MNNLQILEVGKPYPIPIQEGATTNFLTKSGNVFQIGMRDITKEEVYALKKNPVKIGLLIDLPLLLFLFDFGDGFQFDCSFDVRLYSSHQLYLPSIYTKQQRLFVELHLVELNTNIIKVLRAFSMPHDLTVEFLSAVQEQLSTPLDEEIYNNKREATYKYDIQDLIKTVKMYQGGT